MQNVSVDLSVHSESVLTGSNSMSVLPMVLQVLIILVFFLFFLPTKTSQDSVRMGRGSVTFSNMVDMMGTSGEEGETEDCDERVPLLCPASRFIY